MSSVSSKIPPGIFALDPQLLAVIRRFRILIIAFVLAGAFFGIYQAKLTPPHHVRALIEIGYVVEADRTFSSVVSPLDFALKLKKDLSQTSAKDIRSTYLLNGEYKKLTVTIVAALPDLQESKKEFDAVIDRHLDSLSKMEEETGRKFAVKTKRVTPPSTDIICTAGCKATFSILHAVAAALVALAGCILFDRLKGHMNRKGG